MGAYRGVWVMVHHSVLATQSGKSGILKPPKSWLEGISWSWCPCDTDWSFWYEKSRPMSTEDLGKESCVSMKTAFPSPWKEGGRRARDKGMV